MIKRLPVKQVVSASKTVLVSWIPYVSLCAFWYKQYASICNQGAVPSIEIKCSSVYCFSVSKTGLEGLCTSSVQFLLPLCWFGYLWNCVRGSSDNELSGSAADLSSHLSSFCYWLQKFFTESTSGGGKQWSLWVGRNCNCPSSTSECLSAACLRSVKNLKLKNQDFYTCSSSCPNSPWIMKDSSNLRHVIQVYRSSLQADELMMPEWTEAATMSEQGQE